MRKRKMKRPFLLLLGCLLCILSMCSRSLSAMAGTVQNDPTNPYVVTLTCPNGVTAWTLVQDLPQDELKNYAIYKATNTKPSFWGTYRDKVVFRDIEALPEPEKGQHIYGKLINDIVDIAYWRCNWVDGRCIHQENSPDTWNGYDFKAVKVANQGVSCYTAYPSGWQPYCADCGKVLNNCFVYATKEAVSTIDQFDTSSPFFYICPNPNCKGLENSGEVGHVCDKISWNQYKVVYKPNSDDIVTGYTADTYHMYDHHDEYEGYPIDPVKNLAFSGFKRFGYTVTSWNTKSDGSGTSYPLGYEIPVGGSLSDEQYDVKTGKGLVTLYAIWEKTESTLKVDPNGGTYRSTSNITSIKKGYGQTQELTSSEFTAPNGFTVSFDSKGGTACSPEIQTMHFDRLERKDAVNFNGKFNKTDDKYVYEFLGKNGTEDTIIAQYEGDPIILPTPTRPGYSFGGWYKDPELKEFVGGGGDKYTPDRNRTLYAAWTKLVLSVDENYVANNKKGASDLTWDDESHAGKYYKVYISEDGKEFKEVLDAEDGFDISAAGRTYGYTGGAQQYTVPATGTYTISVAGAEGDSYGSFAGGKGGTAEGRFFLKKGDVLTIKVGGKPYGGGSGGAASTKGATGGGGTSIFLNGSPLIVAGGGGGATEGDAGKDGGAEDGLRAGTYSESYMSGASASGIGGGGGGGYIGGLAGVKETHEHTEECKSYHTHTTECYTQQEHTHYCHDCVMSGDSPSGRAEKVLRYIHRATCGCLHSVGYYCMVRDKGVYWCGGCDPVCTPTKCSGSMYVGAPWNNYNCNFHDQFYGGATENVLICDMTYEEGSKGYLVGYTCGYEEGDVISVSGGYGGSNYVSISSPVHTVATGVNEGNGYAVITPSSFGLSGELYVNGVPSPDLEAPAAIDEDSVVITPISTVKCKLSFDMPEDFGTEYYWKVASHSIETDAHIADSNIDKDELITGIDGYRYVYDTTETHGSGYIASLNGGYQFLSAPEHRNDGGTAVKNPSMEMVRYTHNAYLHIAPVDVAGNVGPTIDIVIEPAEQDWTVVTTQMLVSDNLNGKKLGTVYTVGDLNYVRADGTGVFKLSYDAFLDVAAKTNYQIDYQLIEVNPSVAGKTQEFTTYVPYTALNSTVKADVKTFDRTVRGSILNDVCNTGLTRVNTARQNNFFQCFSIPASFDGQLLIVTPVAGVTSKDDIVYSKWESDVLNSAKIMPDAKAPVVTGLEYLEGKTTVNRDEPGFPTVMTVSATDALSGVRSLTVKVVNQSNGYEKTFTRNASGNIELDFTSDSDLYDGDLVITVIAVDNVGNTYTKTYGTEVFRLNSKIVNAYDTTTNVCPQGGAAILGFVTEGYSEEVIIELHDKLKPGNETIQTKWIYTPTAFAQYNTVSFEIPADCTPGTYQVTVKSMKNGGTTVLFDYPEVVVVPGTPEDGAVRVRIR